jgi:hypothetical protein
MPGPKQVFRSFDEFRRYFFPKQFAKEQQRVEVKTNPFQDETKYDRLRNVRQLNQEQVKETGE